MLWSVACEGKRNGSCMATVEGAGWISSAADDLVLGPKAKAVVRILATQPEFTSFAPASAVAARAGTDPATVVRTARALGYSGWPNLRLEVRNRYLASLNAAEVLDEHCADDSSDPLTRAVRSDIAQLALALNTVDRSAVDGVARAMVDARRTLIVASGAFAAPALQLAHVAAFMGLDTEFAIRGGTSLANSVAGLGKDDCLVGINLWHVVREVAEAADIARAAGVTVCAITDRAGSPIARISCHAVVVPSEGTSHFPSLSAAMTVVHAILAEISVLAGIPGQQSMARSEATYARLGLLTDPE
jgi:DNA-binding MurR/RpiR family transcriptional regulator